MRTAGTQHQVNRRPGTFSVGAKTHEARQRASYGDRSPGRGALGAFECGVLEALYESRKGFQPAVITGISIGAVNAAILAGAGIEALGQAWRERFALHGPPPAPFVGMPTFHGPALASSPLGPLAALLQPVYEQLLPRLAQQHLSLLGNDGMYRIRPEYLFAGPAATLFTDSYYDTTPLRQTLQDIVNFERLNSDSEVVVTAVNVATGEVVNFASTRAIEERPVANDESPFANTGPLSLDHILASGSIPPSFPPTRVEGNSFWDGGLYTNTPLSEAINCLERCDGGSRDVEREVIFVELVPMSGNVPTNMQEVVSRLLNIIFSSKLALDRKLFKKVNAYIELAREVDQFLGDVTTDSPLKARAEAIRGLKGYQELMAHRRINAFTRVSIESHPELGNALDFSKETIERRIRAGYEEAKKQGIQTPSDVPVE